MENLILWDDSRKELYSLDKREIDLYNEYIEKDKNIGMFENMFSISDAIRDNMINITKNNIHLYYEFMSDEDIINLGNKSILLSKIHDERHLQIIELLNIDIKELDVYRKTIVHAYNFGIKDTLKPINEYIKEIKNSDEYKKYISEIKE